MPPQATSENDFYKSRSEKDGQVAVNTNDHDHDHDHQYQHQHQHQHHHTLATRSPRAAINFLLTSEVHMEKKENTGKGEGEGEEEEETSPALSTDSLVPENESPNLSTFPSSPEGERLNQTRRRSRTVMTPHQTRLLHKVLEETYFPTAAQRESLSRLLQVPQRTIQIWFQNQRQKAKHQQNQSSQHAASRLNSTAHSPNTATAAAAAAYSFQFQLRSLLSQLSPTNANNFFATAKSLFNIQHLGQVTPTMLTTILTVLQSQVKANGEAFGESPSKRKAELSEEEMAELKLAPLYKQQGESTHDLDSYSPSFEPVAEGEELPSLKSLVSAAMNSPPLPVPCHMHSPPLSMKKMRSRDNLLDVLVEASDSSAF